MTAAVDRHLDAYEGEVENGLATGSSLLSASSQSLLKANEISTLSAALLVNGLITDCMVSDRSHHLSTFSAHNAIFDSLEIEAGMTYKAAQDRLRQAKDDVQDVSRTVLQAVSGLCRLNHDMR